MSKVNHENHLTEEQLIRLAYKEPVPQCDRDHVEVCQECQLKLKRLQEVEQFLHGFSINPPDFNAHTIAEQIVHGQSQESISEKLVNDRRPNATGNTNRLTVESHVSLSKNSPPTPSTFRGWVWASVLSLMLILFAIGFVMGGRYQAQLTREIIRSEFQQQIEQNDGTKATRPELPTKELEQRLVTLLRQVQSESQQPTIRSLQLIESEISRILAVQNRLRQDLQTMAITAENEINLTREDLRQLSEVVDFFLPVLH